MVEKLERAATRAGSKAARSSGGVHRDGARPADCSRRWQPEARRRGRAWASCLTIGLSVSACGPGPYGHSRQYTALNEETRAAAGSEPFDPVMAERAPAVWAQKKVDIFGVVLRRSGAGSGAEVLLSVRTLRPRNLCETRDSSSCRVTVSDLEAARIRARLELKPKDTAGPERLREGSLVRVIGKLEPQAHEGVASDLLKAEFYRHWPPLEYVTDSARGYMRR